MGKILVGENIIKSFGEGKEKRNILDGVSIKIEEGEFLSVMGPSGSGKSTLMYVLSGMDNGESGKVIFADKDLMKLSENELADLRRTKMGFVFQQPSMLKNLNILDNIILTSIRSNKKNIKEITKKGKGLMEKTGLAGLEEREVSQVSGGQLQRAGICRALMNNPKILFGDEPTGALNSKAAEEIMDIFKSINEEGTTIVLVTHDAKVAAKTERVLFLSDGKIVNELNLAKYTGNLIDERIEKVNNVMRKVGI